MQDAWAVDQQSPGTMAQIGYEHPSSTVFTYANDDATDFEATSTVLDKCDDQTWKVEVKSTDGGKAVYEATDNCPALTPNFTKIGSSKAGS